MFCWCRVFAWGRRGYSAGLQKELNPAPLHEWSPAGSSQGPGCSWLAPLSRVRGSCVGTTLPGLKLVNDVSESSAAFSKLGLGCGDLHLRINSFDDLSVDRRSTQISIVQFCRPSPLGSVKVRLDRA